MVADAFGIPNEDLPLFMSGAVEQWHKDQNKFPSEVIEKGPANEVVEEDVDLFKLPIPIHAMKDGGRYFDASVMVVKNPETGIPNISLRRFMVTGKDRMTRPFGIHAEYSSAFFVKPLAFLIGMKVFLQSFV